MRISLFPVLICTMILASCSVDQDIFLKADGSGSFTGQILMDEFYLNTLTDLTDLNAPSEGERTAMDPAMISDELNRNPSLQNIQISSETPGVYKGGMEFHDVEELFYTEKGVASSVLVFKKNRESSTLNIRINSENFQEIFRLLPVLQDPGFQYFLPEPTITRSEYIEMLLFLFEDQFDRSEEELQLKVEKASLNLTIHTDGKILSSKGGLLVDDNQWRIDIPLLDLLLHRKELFYSLTFK